MVAYTETKRPRGHPRKFTRAFLELRPEDYCILEAAAVTTLKRLGLRDVWPVEDLVDFGWERVFFYCRTYEQFRTKGFLACITAMCQRIRQEQKTQAHIVSLENMDDLHLQGEYL